jgi:O-antigen/teichoic acid export membrane protein
MCRSRLGALWGQSQPPLTAAARSHERYRRIALGTLGSVVARGVSIGATMVAVPLTINYLGSERYGLWMTISSTIALLGFADLGLGNGLVSTIAEADGRGDRIAIHRAISSAFYLLVGIALIALVAFAVAFPYIDWSLAFNMQTPLAVREAGVSMAVLVACFAASLPFGIVPRIQVGLQESATSSLWQGLGSLLGLTGILIAVHYRAGLPWLVASMSGGPLLATMLCSLWYLRGPRRLLIPNLKQFDRHVIRGLASSGFLFFLLQLFLLLGTATDSLVIAHVMTPSDVTTYAITKQLFTFTLTLQFYVAPLWPAFGEALARSDYKWVESALKRSLALSMTIGGCAALPLLVYGERLAQVWTASSIEIPPSLLAACFCWVLIGSYGGVMSVFFSNGALLKRQVIFYGAASLLSLALKPYLTACWGLSGPIWATVIAFLLLYVLPAARLSRAVLKQQSQAGTPQDMPTAPARTNSMPAPAFLACKQASQVKDR